MKTLLQCSWPSSRTYAYKIYYVNYICTLNVEKLIWATAPLSNTQPMRRLDRQTLEITGVGLQQTAASLPGDSLSIDVPDPALKDDPTLAPKRRQPGARISLETHGQRQRGSGRKARLGA